jgi:hypothetical protein
MILGDGSDVELDFYTVGAIGELDKSKYLIDN